MPGRQRAVLRDAVPAELHDGSLLPVRPPGRHHLPRRCRQDRNRPPPGEERA